MQTRSLERSSTQTLTSSPVRSKSRRRGLSYTEAESKIRKLHRAALDEITEVTVNATGGKATVVISGLNSDGLSPYQLGEYDGDWDGDGNDGDAIVDHETPGRINITGLNSLGTNLESGTVHNMRVDFEYRAQDLPSEDRRVNTSDAPDYSWDSKATVHYRFDLPTAYELTYYNLELVDTAELPSSRYVAVEYAEGTGTTDFENVSSYSAVTSQYSSKNVKVDVDTTINPSDTSVYKAMVLTDDTEPWMVSATTKEKFRVADTIHAPRNVTSADGNCARDR